MKIIAQALFVLAAIIVLTISCTESTTIGAGLLEQDQADILFTDTLTFTTTTLKVDSVKAYDPTPEERTEIYNRYLCGNYNDPIFGKTDASIYAQFRLTQSGPPSFYETPLAVDSVVLSLVYDSLGFYGDLNEEHELEVYLLTEDMETTIDIDYFSDQDFAVGNTPIGSLRFTPQASTEDSLDVTFYTTAGDTSSFTVAPHIRLPITDPFLGTSFLELDSVTLANNANFLAFFKGLYIKDVSNTNSMLRFDLLSPISNFTIYHHEVNDPSVLGQYSFGVTSASARLTNFEHDFSGTVVENAFNTPSIGDSVVYLQGMSGPFVKVDIPYINSLPENIAINKAELEFTIAGTSAIDFPEPGQIFIVQPDGEELASVVDVTLSQPQSSLETSFASFGGTIEEEANGSRTYKMNISSFVQEMIDGEASSTFYISIFLKHQVANRVALYGPKHSQFPAKINLAYTNLSQ